MTYRIDGVDAIEILDSRGLPTLQVAVRLAGGAVGVAGVPAGASTGRREATELRDGEAGRFAGRGVRAAVANVQGEIAGLLRQRVWDDLEHVDRALIELDGTHNKSRLGANAIVGVSMAAARAMAANDGEPLYRWLMPSGVQARLPVPHFNVVNGGAHAANLLDFQEFMVAPVGAPNFAEALRCGAEVYGQLRDLL